jgi:DNA helicase-2/ATP-dependent DNA helicase PcrA
MEQIVLPQEMSGGWIVVLGAPGCGKTTSLLRFLKEEIGAGTPPHRIAFVSFTRAARLEVLQRIARDFGIGRDDMPWLRTIHSVAYKLLGLRKGQIMAGRAWRDFADKYHYNLTDPRDSDQDIDIGGAEPPRRSKDDLLRYVYEWGRNRRLYVERSMGKCPVNVPATHFRLFIERLVKFKTEKGLLDFTDILDSVLEKGLRPDVDVAFVDEAQDLSPLQIAVVEQWFKPCRSVYIAGDEDQAIYSFQGAEPDWLISLSKQNVTVLLGQSHRVPPQMHVLAQQIIRRNRKRIDKPYCPTTIAGIVEHLALEQALQRIDGETETLVLARNRMFLKRAANILFHSRVPYVVEGIGGVSPLSPPSAVCAVRAAHRIWQGKGVDASALNALLAQIPSRGSKLLPHGVKARAKERKGFISLEDMRDQLGLGSLIEFIQKEGPTAPLLRIWPAHRAYFQALLDRYGELPQPRVHLTTIHAAKGREADVVVVLPDMTRTTYLEYRDGARGGNEAENRVFYVAVTRARKRLILVNPVTKRYYDYPRLAGLQGHSEEETPIGVGLKQEAM